jgi:hypothetical protein
MTETSAAASDEANKHMEQYISIWQKVVDTQMHFNEMSVKSRQLGLAFVAAALGVGIVLLARGETFSVELLVGEAKMTLHLTVFLMLGAIVAVAAVRQLDLNVYHKMLRGAVAFGEDFEENYMKHIFNLNMGLTQSISHFSRHSDARAEKDGTRYKYIGSNKKSAEQKIRKFYNLVIMSLILAAILIFVIQNSKWLIEVVGS